MTIDHTVAERFLRYVQIDTQSDPNSTTYPSTEKQKNMLRLLVTELKEMGIADADMDENGYVYATIPATTTKKNVPTICFCAHVDTAPDCSGTDVKPIVHRNYDGSDLVLPDDTTVIISPKKHPELLNNIGNDIINFASHFHFCKLSSPFMIVWIWIAKHNNIQQAIFNVASHH